VAWLRDMGWGAVIIQAQKALITAATAIKAREHLK